MTRMRVTWICLEWPRDGEHSGGVGRYVYRLAETMKDLVDLTVIAFEGAVEMPGVTHISLPRPTSRIGRYYGAAWKLRSMPVVGEADLVHSHGDDWALRRQVPVVRSFYGSSWREARSSSGLRSLNHYVLAITEKWSQRKARLRLGIAPESVDAFRCHTVFPPYLAAAEVPTESPADMPTVVFIGSYRGRKQGWLAERSVRQVRASNDPLLRSAELTVIGPATDAASWEPWVTHLSGLSDLEVREVLARGWLLASPSTYEGFGIPVLEALESGLPVVALENPGSSYLVTQANASVPVVIADPEGFSSAVERRLASGPGLSPEERQSARSLVADISAAGSSQRLLDLYKSVGRD